MAEARLPARPWMGGAVVATVSMPPRSRCCSWAGRAGAVRALREADRPCSGWRPGDGRRPGARRWATTSRPTLSSRVQLMKPTILLFDIDGTLVTTGGVGRLALQRTFERLFGRPGVYEGFR